MERNVKKRTLQPMAQMSQDAIQTLDQLKLNDKSALKPINSSSSYVPQHPHHHRLHHQTMTTRPSHGNSEEQPKSISLSPASAACQMRLRFPNDEDPSLRSAASAAAGKQRSGKKSPTTTAGHNSFPTKSASSNQSRNHSFLWKQVETRNGDIRSKAPLTSARRTSLPMRDDRRKSSASFSLPNSRSNDANAMNLRREAALLQLQEEKPFRISPMGYDSRYEDLIYESQRCVDDDIAPEQTTQAIDKCKLWLKKHHVDNYGSRANHH